MKKFSNAPAGLLMILGNQTLWTTAEAQMKNVQGYVFILGKADDHIECNLSWDQMIHRWYNSFWSRNSMM